MAIQLALTEGESLLILQRRSGKSVDEVAKMLDINPSHLSKIFRSENLTSKIKSKASSVFSLPDSFFESKSIASDKALDYVQETGVKYTRRSASSKGMFLTIDEAFKYLEEKDRRHYEERSRLLDIIENLSKRYE